MINGEAFNPPVVFFTAILPLKSTRPLLTNRLSSCQLIKSSLNQEV